MEEVYVEVELPAGTGPKLVKCFITNKALSVTVKDQVVLKVSMHDSIMRISQLL